CLEHPGKDFVSVQQHLDPVPIQDRPAEQFPHCPGKLRIFGPVKTGNWMFNVFFAAQGGTSRCYQCKQRNRPIAPAVQTDISHSALTKQRDRWVAFPCMKLPPFCSGASGYGVAKNYSVRLRTQDSRRHMVSSRPSVPGAPEISCEGTIRSECAFLEPGSRSGSLASNSRYIDASSYSPAMI